MTSLYTVTGLANFGFTPLFWRPQEAKLYTEFKLVVWCAKIEPKTKKGWKTSEITREMSKNYRFMFFFWSFLVLNPILAHQTTRFELSGWFCFLILRHPWRSWGRQSSGVICIWIIFQLIFGWWRRLVKKNSSWSLMSPLSFYMHKKWHYHFA